MVILALVASAVPVIKSTRADQFRRDDSERKFNKDYSKWFDAAMEVRGGERLYVKGQQYFGDFIYPPSSAVIFYTPLSLAGRTAMVVLLCVLTLAAHAVAVYASVYFARGRWRDEPLWLYVIPFGWTAPYVWDVYLLGQFNLVMLGFLLGGFVVMETALLRAGRATMTKRLVAGGLMALAISAKAFPLPVVVYLLWRRAWVALVGVVIGLAAVVIVLPSVVRGAAVHLEETGIWVDRMILSTSSKQLSNQPWRAFRAGNQSLISVLTRLTRPTEQPEWPTSNPREDFNVNFVDLGPKGAWGVVIVVTLGLLGGYVLAMSRAAWLERRFPPPDSQAANDRLRRRGLEIGILLLLIVLLSPKAGTYYFSWAIPGITLALAEWLDAPWGSARKWLIGLGLTLSALVSAAGLGQALQLPVQTYGASCFGNLLLVLLLLVILAFPPTARAEPAREPLT